jgi:DNA-directed RNA polymerase subunit beta'
VRFKGIVCERCGVEVTRAKVRRERMGHIELAAPVVHIWYLRGTRSWLAYLLMGTTPKEELKAKQLEKVIYFAANMVTACRRRGVVTRTWPNLRRRPRRRDRRDQRAPRAVTVERRPARARRRRWPCSSPKGAKESELRTLSARHREGDRPGQGRSGEERRVGRDAFDDFRGPTRSSDHRATRPSIARWSSRYSEYFEGGMGAEAI